MIIPVAVQKPNKPDTRVFVGRASEDLTPKAVAAAIGLPDDCFIYDAKILKHRKGELKGQRYWSLVADVDVVAREIGTSRGHPISVCPHCGGELP